MGVRVSPCAPSVLEARRDYARRHYRLHRAKHVTQAVARNKRNRKALADWINEYKGSRGCSRCPERDYVCLDFHHSAGEKDLNVSAALRKCWTIARVTREIEKCEILCANCHRKEHARLRGYTQESHFTG